MIKRIMLVVLMVFAALSVGWAQSVTDTIEADHRDKPAPPDALVRDSGLLAEVFEQYPDAKAHLHPEDAEGIVLVEFTRQGEVVGWATVRDQTVLAADKGAPTQTTLHGTDWWLNELLPHYRQSALLCLAFVVVMLVGFDFSRAGKARNWDLLSLFIIAVPSLGTLLYYGSEHNSVRFAAWSVIFAGTAWLFVRSLMIAWSRRPRPIFEPNLPVAGLVILLALVGIVHFEKIARQDVGGSGTWSVRGAQHILSRGELPYGKLGASDTYGPLLYLAHTPATLAFPPTYVDAQTGKTVQWSAASQQQKARLAQLKDELRAIATEKDLEKDPIALRKELIEIESSINRLPKCRSMKTTAARVTAGVFDVLILLGIIVIGKRWVNLKVGLSAAVIYGLLPYTIERLGHVSALLPMAMIVWAVVLTGYPLVAGLLLGLGASATFFPVFLFPLWLGYYVQRGGAVRFIVAFALIGVISVAGLWLYTDNWTEEQFRQQRWHDVEAELDDTDQALQKVETDSEEGNILEVRRQQLRDELQSLKRPRLPLAAFFGQTVLRQEGGPGTHGASLQGFWGQVRAGGFRFGALKPIIMLLTFTFCITLFFVPTHKEPFHLIILSAAVLISTQLWKTHTGGLATWYAPLLVLGFVLYEGEKTENNRPEKFVPLQDVNSTEPEMPSIEDIDEEIARQDTDE